MVLVIFATLITCLLGLSGGMLFLTNIKPIKKIQEFGPLIAFIVILATVVFELLPEAFENDTLQSISIFNFEIPLQVLLIIAGFIGCAIFGYVLGHFHHHADMRQKKRNEATAKSMFVVDTIHNAADGIVLGVSFLAGVGTGLSTCLATLAHEIPQEIGDFAIMKRAKFKNKTIIVLQTLSALVTVITSSLIYAFATENESFEGFLGISLSLVAGFLIYIALSELIEVIHEIKK
ncbi:MAG: ZIP family metal transporter [Candidatus Saccharibacteria bacterium]|nr:ZIP family metal transporter [Candidatus Saccharibacteria bacterium]